MKTIFKILGILVLVILLAIFILPFIFKGKIIELAKEEINKNVNAQVSFSDIDMNLFSHFPNFTLNLSGLTIVGTEAFAEDTLANIPNFSVIIDLGSVITGDSYEVKSIIVDRPQIKVKILENGQANYDIAVESTAIEEDVSPEAVEASGFHLTLKNFEIRDGRVNYVDESLNMGIRMNHINHRLSGDLTEDFTSLNTKTSIGSMDIDYKGIRYISKAVAHYDAIIDADLKNEIYTLKKNSLTLNKLLMQFSGSFSFVGDDYNLVLTFDTPKTDFKTLLSMVPAVYSTDFENIESSGKFSINGNIKGLYTDTSLPTFALNMTIDDGRFKYPDLPSEVSNISMKASITNPGGDIDNTRVDVSNFHMQLGDNPFDFKLRLMTPVSDPDMDAEFNGKLDLGSISDFYPLEAGDELNGEFLADIRMKGKLSAIENEQYEDFTALGSLLIQQLKYKTSLIPEAINISNAQLNFSPQYLDLVSFKMKIGENDLSAHGRIENAIAWAMKDEMLTGELTTLSSHLNLNDLMPSDSAADENSETISETDTVALSVIEIPDHIEFNLKSSFDQLIYDDLLMENANGKIFISNRTVFLENLSMNILDGEMTMNGFYATPRDAAPNIDFNLDISEVNIQKAYNTFAILKEYVPIAKKTEGSFSTQMILKSELDNEMMPIYETMEGGGELSATQIVIKDVNTLNKIADVIKWEEIKHMRIDKILFQFEFVDGKIKVEPFDLKSQLFAGSLGGYTGFDKSIDYLMKLEIPRNQLGGSANAFLGNITSKANASGANFNLGETIPLKINIGGTLDQPTVSSGIGDSKGSLGNQVKEGVKKEIEKKKEEISKEARERAQKVIDDADIQGRKMIAEAQKQADNIRKNAADAAKKIRSEADKQASKLEAEGKKKGFLAQAAAKESAKKIRKKANEQADKLEKETDTKANKLVKKARDQSARLKQEAEKESDKILKRN